MAIQVMPEESRVSLGDSAPDLELVQDLHRPEVLVVDDENGPRQALRMLLKEDYEVYLASNVPDALDILREQSIELVITDVRMPKFTGVDLLRDCKEINPDIQVIIFTGYGQLETAMKAVEYGAFAYMEKPFENSVMMNMVKSAQGKYRREKERRIFEDLAMEASRFETLGRLVSGTMHDLGTPLTVLSSHIELMLMCPDRDDITKRLETMKSQVQYCAEMTKATMGYLRHDQRPGSLIQINAIIQTCHAVGKPLLRETRVDIEVNTEEDLPEVKGDMVLLRQAIMNLITNACQAMKELDTPHRLFVTTWQENGQVCVSVEDTGPGIPKAMRESVFDTFFSTKGKSGTGLGLGVVRNVMLRCHGTAALEDGRNGAGACFVLRLPIEE
jgi:signal transduction histidine kinase